MHRLVTILLSLAALVTAAVLSLPWWLGVALGWIGPSFGMTFGHYERMGYSRFHLQDVEIRRSVVRVKVDTVDSDTPAVWLWRRMVGEPGTIAAGTWSVEVEPSHSDTPATATRGWVPLRKTLDMVADRLAYWLPRASAGAGVVTWPGETLTFASVDWQNRTLVSSVVGYRMLKAEVRLRVPSNREMRVSAVAADGLGADLESKGTAVTGTVRNWGQSATLTSVFAEQGWQPLEATLRAEAWKISGEALKLGGHYGQIRGDGRIEWRGGALTADVDVAGEPIAKSGAPPIGVTLHGSARAGGFVAESLHVELPGINAHLSEPVTIDQHGRLTSAPARFTFDVDLSRQPWLQARGKMTGDGHIAASVDGLAAIDFYVHGDKVAVNQSNELQADVAGRFVWPRLEISRVNVVAKDGGELRGGGGWDIAARELMPSHLSGRLGSKDIEPWIHIGAQFAALTFEANAEGRWPELRHHGMAKVEALHFPDVNPLAVELTWRGSGWAADQFAVNATAGKTHLSAAGAVDLTHVRLTDATFSNGENERLRLVQPAVLAWKPSWQVDQVTLSGPEARLEGSLTWGETGKVDLAVRQVESEWLRDLLPLPAGAWAVDSLTLHGTWANGPMTFAGDVRASVDLDNQRSATLGVELRGDKDGVEIVSLRGSEGEGVIIAASGRLPVTFTPGAMPLGKVDFDAPFSFNAATSSNPEFWDKITQLSGIEIVKPEATARLEGTLNRPKGEVRLHAERLAAAPGRYRWDWPRIEALDVRFTGTYEGVKLDGLSVMIDGQLVRAQGTLPVSGEHWRELLENPRTSWRHGDLHLEVPDAEIAAIAHHFPDYFAPKGRLQVDLHFKADETITGFLKVQDATSRPLGPLGVLQEINAAVRFGGRTVQLESVTARMGGQQVTLTGTAELPPGDEPQLDFSLKGENLPFVRRTGLLVRGDLDLKLTSSQGRTAIGGNVRLRDSLFLADLASLLPTGAKESARRPPYFSVEAVPLNAWRLEVTVQGEKFLRLRTPVFNGTASARIQLGGTLGNPRATGEAVIDEGTIRLPFASFDVRQGQVRLSPEQPEPQLLVNATTRRYGYDLRLELTGAASAPVLTFSSSPPLEAEQVLLMVMAGEAPHNEVATTDRQRAARFGAFFGQSLLGSLGGDSSSADRLTISSGENISAQGRETYSIEYKLDEKWSLTGEYDEFDDYYGGLKWRFYQRGGRKPDEKK